MKRLLLYGMIIFNTTGASADRARIKRAPAVWGDAAPDYSAVDLGNAPYRYLYTLLFVDDKITGFYEYDMTRVKNNILKVVEEANTYFNQLRLGIVVVDVMQTMRSNLSLYGFQDYRSQRLHKLPPHDFAALITYRYAGGLAFVGGLCTDKAVMLCGVAHLVGIPHRPANYSLYVSNCACNSGKETGECLRIPGFDHDCTAQQFVNVMYQKKCIRTTPLVSSSEPICGNGVTEEDEDCDCGLPAQCNAWNCRPESCTYRVQPMLIWLLGVAFITVTSTAVAVILRYRRAMLNCFKVHKDRELDFCNGRVRALSASPSRSRKRSTGGITNSTGLSTPASVPHSVTLQRPKKPPPPPPIKASIAVDPSTSYARQISTNRDDISWKFEEFDSDEEESSSNQKGNFSSYPGQPGVPTCPSYPAFVPINRVTVAFHGSGATMETLCTSSGGSSTSDASL